MTVNMEKTVCQLFTLSTRDYLICVRYKDKVLHREDNFSYFGVFLDKLLWRRHTKEAAVKGEARLILLKRLSGVTWD